MNTNIDIRKTPFSRYGSYLAISHDEAENRLILHNVRRRFKEDYAYYITFEKDNKQIIPKIEADPSCIYVSYEDASCTIAICDDESMIVSNENMDVRFAMNHSYGYGTQYKNDRFELICAGMCFYTMITMLEGKASIDNQEGTNPAGRSRPKLNGLFVSGDEKATIFLKLTQTENWDIEENITIDSTIKSALDEWNDFLGKMPAVSDSSKDIAETTWYNLWSCFVRAQDCYKYDAMLMSKKNMCSVWSWDHCFNALAMARIDKKIAIEQFLIPFELQSESGVLPDMWNPNSEIVWGVTKPPIHGWCFDKLMDIYDFDDAMLKKVYVHLENWTMWWMNYRDSDNDGVPEYPQGCDSGWDNSTLFDVGYFLESPDLPAFLILQMNVLSRISNKLDNKENASYWSNEALDLTKRLYEHSWSNDRFMAPLSGSHVKNENPTSLLSLMPIVLGDKLEKDKLEKLVKILKKDFITDRGLATESPKSDLYISDGYWRGPIWAPSTYLIIDGLRRGGYEDLAKEIGVKFCHMIREIAGGNYENFDAINGVGLRAPGYTWTASVNMLLMWEYGI